MNTYALFTTVRLSVLFRNALTQQPSDPTAINLFVQSPSGGQQTFTYAAGEIVRDGVGAYHYDFTFNASSIWIYNFQGTGALEVSSGDIRVAIMPSVFPLAA